jgi:hypothetical protein
MNEVNIIVSVNFSKNEPYLVELLLDKNSFTLKT